MNTALVVRLDSAGDVLVTGPAVRAVAAAHDRVVMLVGPRGRAAAALLPGIDEIIEWQAPWVDFDSPDLTADHVEALVKQLRDLAADRVFIFTSFHQSPLPMALLCQMAGAPWIGAICEDYPGTLLNLRHHVAARDSRTPACAVAGRGRRMHATRGRRRRPTSSPGSAGCPARWRVSSVTSRSSSTTPARRCRPACPAPPAAPTWCGLCARPATGWSSPARRPKARSPHRSPRRGAVDLGGRTDLAELAAVLRAARVAVAPNTGPAHLAAAVGTPVVSLFAPVVPASQWRPFGTSVTVLGDQTARCRATRARQCPVPGHPCLDGITDEALLAAVHQWAGEP